MKKFLFLFFCIVFTTVKINAQNCGIKNPSFESYTNCPTGHSQFDGYVTDWQNALSVSVSTPDYFNKRCDFENFQASGVAVNLFDYSETTGCGYAGLFLNYNDGTQDPKYREYILQRVDLVAGRTYQLEIDLARSTFSASNDLETDFTIYGYSGAVPASQINFCLVDGSSNPIDELASIDESTINSILSTFTVTFTPTQNHDYIVLGGGDCGTDATEVGYVFIEKVLLTDTSVEETLSPVIETVNGEIGQCCASKSKDAFTLTGNAAPTGATITWGQLASNPETITFDAPNASSTGVTETGDFIAGIYNFTYSFSKSGCTITDTLKFEIKADITISAGPDEVFCQTDATGPEGANPYNERWRAGVQLSALPNTADIIANDYRTWWTVILNDGTEYLAFNQIVTDTDLGYDGYMVGGSGKISNHADPLITGGSPPEFWVELITAYDSLQFVWHVQLDECAEILTDTALVIQQDIDFDFSGTSNQPFAASAVLGDVLVLPQYYGYSYFSTLKDAPELSIAWEQVSGPGTLTFLDNTIVDDFRITADACGQYHVRLTVTNANTGCSFYDEALINFLDISCVGTGAADQCVCSLTAVNNDNTSGTCQAACRASRIVTMAAEATATEISELGLETYWSLIQNDGTEWIFPNGCVPDDGADQGDVLVNNITTVCSSSGGVAAWRSNGPSASFTFSDPTFTYDFVWHMIDPATGNHYRDTVNVCKNDVDFDSSSSADPLVTICGNETGILHQSLNPELERLLAADGNFTFDWSQESGPGTLTFLNQGAEDSLQITSTDAGGYLVRLTITDNDLGCKWYDEAYVQVINSFTINAGVDNYECVSGLLNTTRTDFNMNASPTDLSITQNGYCTWWSMIQDNGVEWVFANSCGAAYDGNDQGDVYTLETGLNPDNANQKFTIRGPGVYDMIWHVYDPCTGTIEKDTLQIGVGELEPLANAGPDISVSTCNTVQLNGNVSAASAANTGCYQWSVVSGPGPLNILGANHNVAYVSGLENAVAGTYTIEYEVGCDPCSKTDQMELTISGTPPASTVTLNSDVTDVCYGQTVNFTAAGADLYTFLIDGQVVQEQSPLATFSYAEFDSTSLVEVLGFHNGTGCLDYSNSSEAITINVDAGPQPTDPDLASAYPEDMEICTGETVDLVALAPGYNILWFTEPNPNTATPLNGPTGTPSGTIFSVSPTETTIYYGYAYDPTMVQCMGYLPFTISVKVWNVESAVSVDVGFYDICAIGDRYIQAYTEDGRSVLWYDNAEGTGDPLNPGGTASGDYHLVPNVDSSAVYYAFGLDEDSGCTSVLGTPLNIPLAGGNPVNLTSNYDIVCSIDNLGMLDIELTAELDNGSGGTIAWYQNNTASGSPVNGFAGTPAGTTFINTNAVNANTFTGELIYYAFDKDALNSGCATSPYDSLIISFSEGPTVLIDNFVYGCDGENVNLNDVITSSETDTVFWYIQSDLVNPLNPGGTHVDDEFNINATLSIAGTRYYVRGIDSLGCLTVGLNSTQLSVGIDPQITGYHSPAPNGGLKYTVRAVGYGPLTEITWNSGEKDTLTTGQFYEFNFPCLATTQTITATFRDLTHNCISVRTFDVSPCVTIGNLVWLDDDLDGIIESNGGTDKNGIQNLGEPGIENVRVILAFDGVFSSRDTTYTDANGNYSFQISDPIMGGYYTVFVDYTTNTDGYLGLLETFISQGSEAEDSDRFGSHSSVEYSYSTLAAFGEDLDFGFYKNQAQLSGIAWLDDDGDGGLDVGESVMENVEVTLYLQPGSFPWNNMADTLTTFTNADGIYVFDDIYTNRTFSVKMNPGTHTNGFGDLLVTPNYTTYDPAWISTSTIQPTDSAASNFPLNHWGYQFPDGINGGFVRNEIVIENFVWEDSNADGFQDPSEVGIPGVTVTAWGYDNLTGTWVDIISTVTDANGLYSLTITDPIPWWNNDDIWIQFDETTNTEGYANFVKSLEHSGAASTEQSVCAVFEDKILGYPTIGQVVDFGTFNVGQIIHIDAGFFKNNLVIEDYVWHDLDKDGIQDVGEVGIEGVEVTLKYNGGADILTTSTGPNGLYSFSIAPGDYVTNSMVLTFDASTNLDGLSNLTFTIPNYGFDDEIDSDIYHDTEQYQSYPFLAQEHYGDTIHIDAGFFEINPTDILIIEDFVWFDDNQNGIQDLGEPGIEDVLVELYFGGTLMTSMMTDNTGYYHFEISQISGKPILDLLGETTPISVRFTPTSTPTYPDLAPTLTDVPSDETKDSDVQLYDYGTGFIAAKEVPVMAGITHDVDAGFVPDEVTIGDFVWLDLNGNGIQNTADPGIEGVEIHILTLDDSGNDVYIDNVITDSDGAYSYTITNASTVLGASQTILLVFDHTTNTDGYNLSVVPNDVGTNDAIDSDYVSNLFFGEDAEYAITNVAFGSTYDIDAGFIDPSVTTFPVELIDFKAIEEDCTVLLSWTTATESNNSHFDILRSENGIDFEPIGKVFGQGNSTTNHTYTFIDENIRAKSYFYQLRQVDLNGHHETFDVRNVKLDCLGEFGNISLYPNPVGHQMVSIKFNSNEEKNAQIDVFNVHGQVLKQLHIDVQNGLNIFEFDLDNYPAGQYMIRLSDDRTFSKFFKLIKINP